MYTTKTTTTALEKLMGINRFNHNKIAHRMKKILLTDNISSFSEMTL